MDHLKDESAERAIIGAVLLDNAALSRAEAIIERDDFYSEQHRLIWGAYLATVGPIDPVTISATIRRLGLQKSLHGEFISWISTQCPVCANIERYAGIVRDFAERRRALQNLRSVATKMVLDLATEDWRPSGQQKLAEFWS